MTVCLTGDVHHTSMATRDQQSMDRTEVEVAIEYAEIAAVHDVPVTLFCTGKCITEERDRMARLAAMDNVELGGHNYWAFTTPVHRTWRALGKITGGRVGSWNGPRTFQSREIAKTIDTFREIDTAITCWRDHAYRHDGHTPSLLSDHGITHFSDAVGPDERVRTEEGVTVVPINTMPDHEHVYHAFRTPEFVAEHPHDGPFGTDSHEPSVWADMVLDRIDAHRNAGRTATVLAHPACMALADDFAAFERICESVADDAIPVTDVDA